MVAYRPNELISSTELAKKFGKVISQITSHTVEKIGVLKNNKLEAVVISQDEYQRLKDIEELYEHIDIYEQIRDRKELPADKYLDGKDVLKSLNLSLED